MKQTILQTGVFFLTLIFGFQTQAQVIITEAAFPRPVSFVDSIYRSIPTTLTLPSEGAAQVWDYSGLVLDGIIEKEFYDATDDPDFPGALSGTIADLIFQGFLIESDAYDGLDADGWYDLGRYTFEVGYSITTITGGPNDLLTFPETFEIFDGRINYIDFPLEYQNQWTQSRVEDIPFELTVAAFGLDQTPGKRQRNVSHVREVVGYGELTLPYADGTPTLPMDVLLVKAIETQIDSVFLGGAPAPEALMNAFGLTQGTTTTETVYIFYTPGFGAPVMSIDEGEDLAFYRPQAAANVTAVYNLDLSPISYFPNPVSPGKTITISTELPLNSGSVRFTDLAGRQIYQIEFESGIGNQIQIKIPATFGSGMYMYHVLDAKGVPVGLGKLQVE